MKNGLSQEGLKLIACVSMLLDHMGAMFFPKLTWLRIIGRLAFPIYCFLLVEGMERTRNVRSYQNRLLLGVVLAEIPFDLAVCGGISWDRCSVMVTLWLASLAMAGIRNASKLRGILLCLGTIAVAEILNCDYGAMGVVTVLVIYRARGQWMLIALWLAMINWSDLMAGINMYQIATMASVIPMMLYSGRKLTRSKAVQWGFYLFYPVHLLILSWI